MAVNEIVGDVFTTEAKIIGHGVNIKGDMSGGIAAVIKEKYPETVYKPYHKACEDGELELGYVLETLADEDTGLWIFNMATQINPGRDARLDAVKSSLELSVITAKTLRETHIALPRIGAGIGGLEWDDVLALIQEQSDLHPEFTFDVYTLPEQPKMSKLFNRKNKVRETSSLTGGANG